ncbi:MAG: MoaD/ThiS family protein [Chloroflexi bacterium]|nr:MoaD/ThiS family protein [Chloroflexota bacterium]
MTHVSVKFTGLIWERVRVYHTSFAFEGESLGELLNALFAQYAVRDIVLDTHDQFVFRSGVLINGRAAKLLGGLRAPIREGDEVILMRPSIGAA